MYESNAWMDTKKYPFTLNFTYIFKHLLSLFCKYDNNYTKIILRYFGIVYLWSCLLKPGLHLGQSPVKSLL